MKAAGRVSPDGRSQPPALQAPRSLLVTPAASQQGQGRDAAQWHCGVCEEKEDESASRPSSAPAAGLHINTKAAAAKAVSGFRGYAGKSLDFLRGRGLEVGDRVRATAKGGIVHEGIVMPRYESGGGDGGGGPGRLVIKLASGYNVGLEMDEIEEIEAAAGGLEEGRPEEPEPEAAGGKGAAGGGLPRILLLSTGGTIASRIDYRTGAVTPAVTAGELSASVPELGRIARVEPRILFSEYSENIEPDHWMRLASELDSAAGGGEGYAGAIVAHGTDTMQYTASYVSFALRGYPLPVAFVGSQRSSDRPSSDAALNLIAAARLIASGRAGRGVYVVMHMDGGDSAAACHLATRVRKCHTSRRDAFRTIGGEPAFVVRHDRGGEVEARGGARDYFGGAEYSPEIAAGRGAVLVKCHPGYDPAALDHMIEAGRCRAVIFEGTGLGHVGRPLYPTVKRAAERGVFMGMASQCVEGRVRMTVYESGRDLLAMGIVPLGDMLAETALAKAVWALGREDAQGGGARDPAAAADALRAAMLETVASEASAG